jgi:hypothetical protein
VRHGRVRGVRMIQCHSCAARAGEASFPRKKLRGSPWVCTDCTNEQIGAGHPQRIERPVLLTRKAWRARARVRQASPQRDLLDWASA